MRQQAFLEATSIFNLPSLIKLARQKATSGAYTDSLKLYKKALTSILNHISPMQDAVMREEWKLLISDIKKETQDIANIAKLLRQLKQAATPQSEDAALKSTQKPLFSVPLRSDKENKAVHKKDISSILRMPEPKTPTEAIKKDVWDAPLRIESKRARNRPTWKGTCGARKCKESAGSVGAGCRHAGAAHRNYSKPWNEAKGSGKGPEKWEKQEKQEKWEEGSGTFVEHCYPGGDGPDADLIRMLERDVIVKLPKVSFNDIAELNEAKNALKEAILLPLLMPSVFVVSFDYELGDKEAMEGSASVRPTRNRQDNACKSNSNDW